MTKSEGRMDMRPSGLRILNPDTMFDPAPMGFSQMAIIPAGARTVHVAGQTGGAHKGDFANQCRTALGSIDTAMRAAGGTLLDVAKLTVYIVDHDKTKHSELITAVGAAFGSRLVPTCTIVPLSQSGTSRDQLVEIEAVGVIV
ncbi:RidA family protein [Roseovarius aquimarinus]|uniref:RidA family protein n=1 Tax=Roseovarius aquimarinus TaxID=1229156 RepID=A0ABW7I810_9RHOB